MKQNKENNLLDENSPFENEKENNNTYNSLTDYMKDKNIEELGNEKNDNNIKKVKAKSKEKDEHKTSQNLNETIEELDYEHLYRSTYRNRHFMENTIAFKNKKEKIEKKRINIYAQNPKEFNDYLLRLKEYNIKHIEKLEELKYKTQLNEKKKFSDIPNINKKSKELFKSDNISLLERMKKEEEKTKLKKKRLEEQILEERKKKKENELKVNNFEIRKKKFDEKWNKRLEFMNNISKKNKEKFEKIKLKVNEEKMKEYIFQPKTNKRKNNNSPNNKKSNLNNSMNYIKINNKQIKNKRTGSAIITNRLYDEDLLKRKEKKDNLTKKYTPSFQPKICEKSKIMTVNRKKNEYMYYYKMYNDNNYFDNSQSNGQSYSNTQWNIHNKIEDDFNDNDKSNEDENCDFNNDNRNSNKLTIEEIDEELIPDLNMNKDEKIEEVQDKE